MKTVRLLGALVISACSMSACSVKLLDENETPSVANTCHATSECGANASCTNGACVATSGSIDQVLLEVVPDSRSEFGGLSFVSTLDNVMMGDPNRAIDLPATTEAVTPAVRIDPADFPDCFTGLVAKQQITARIEYIRASSVGGVPILGLPVVSVAVDTPPPPATAMNSPNARISLFPGTYDIYIQPASTQPDTDPKCELAPRMLRGVVVAEGAPGSAAHASLELPKPTVLNGTVVRGQGASLVGWTIDVIEPQEGRMISTVGHLGAADMNFLTNFSEVSYQPLSPSPTMGTSGNTAVANSPLVRMIPPPEMAATAPTVYWNLATVDINGDSKLSLDMTGVPTPNQLVEVTGQVKGDKVGVHASVRFFSISLENAAGITAVFNPSVVTDDQGRYSVKLFPGRYRIVAVPDMPDQGTLASLPSSSDTAAPSGASVTNPWAITEMSSVPIAIAGSPPVTIALAEKIRLKGMAVAEPMGAPAVGATFEAVPSILLTKVGALRGALAQTPALPPSASVPIADDTKGTFSLPVDPGDFDLSLRPADASNFAWWVLPAKAIDATSGLIPLLPRLPLPVPIEGTITIPSSDDPTKMARVVLRNASVRAYAKVPSGTGVTKVGETRTDDSGHYRLGLPASFGK